VRADPGAWVGQSVNDRNPTEYASAAEALRLMVLRGDGLTTTSLEILTGRQIRIQLLGQQTVLVAEPAGGHDDGAARGLAPVAHGRPTCVGGLDVRPGDELLIRRVNLMDAASTVYAVARTVAVLNRMPATVAQTLFTTPMPFGKALAADGVAVTRELRRWGGYRAGRSAPALGPTLTAASVVPGRTYRLLSSGRGEPLAVITEWFAPRLFDRATGRSAAE